jgi:hypothetical protein
MIVTKQEKDKTTIVVPRRMRKAELARTLDYIALLAKKVPGTASRKTVQELADNLSASAWEKIKQKCNFKWL